MFVEKRFTLREDIVSDIQRKHSFKFGFGGFGEIVYQTNYSRRKPDGTQEKWMDTCRRVVEGALSIRKNWYSMHSLKWDDQYWTNQASDLLYYIYTLKMLPPGRGLWAQGTEYVYERGSMALNNCGASAIWSDSFAEDLGWVMDSLMCGTGVGLRLFTNDQLREQLEVPAPKVDQNNYIDIADSREGWVNSVIQLLNSHRKGGDTRYISFNYDKIRKLGSPIKGFGGTASGPKPLIELHERIRKYMYDFIYKRHDHTRTFADIANAIGQCIIAGNVRRSAELILGSPHDDSFLNLKNYELHPERAEIGWMSNNTALFQDKSDFSKLEKIAEMICVRGEPGISNMHNVQKYERFGQIGRPDKAFMCNPCSEIPLEDKELCNLMELFPVRAKSKKEWLRMCELGTMYTTSVSLLPTHNEETNAVVARNRRIGISICGVSDWFDKWGAFKIIRFMRAGYDHIKETAQFYNEQAGVPIPIRITTVKPSGTVSQLAGLSPGMHFPTHKFAIRRMRISETSPVLAILERAGIPVEDEVNNKGTKVIEYPIYTGATRPISEVTAWEQFSLLALLQREWSDNMVSCTISFKEEEKNDLSRMLAHYIPLIKSVSLLPIKSGIYPQMPYEGITEEEYKKRVECLKPLDWSNFEGSDGKENKYCSNDTCEL